MALRDMSSPNFNDRADGLAPSYLILHYTEITARETEDRFMNALPTPCGPPASAHYMVDCDGTVTRFVPEDKRAWHAGRSRFDELQDLNSRSIGIELVHPGHTGGCSPYPEGQMAALIILCKEIMARQPIPPGNVLGHSDIAPDRKIDPGEWMDWNRLAQNGIGLWPDPDDIGSRRFAVMARG